MKPYGCQHECADCGTPKACAFLREFDERRDEERRSAQMLGGVLLVVLLICTAGAVWALANFLGGQA